MDRAKHNTDTLEAFVLKLCWEKIDFYQKFYKFKQYDKLMETQINPQEIMKKLIKLQADVDFIKNNMVDIDYILDEDDREALRLAEEEYRNGETISHEELKKELEL